MRSSIKIGLCIFLMAWVLTACNLPDNPSQPQFTPTPDAPMLTVSIETVLRAGPGENYDPVGSFLPGQIAEVVGTNAEETYFLIRDPANASNLVWIIKDAAKMSGTPVAVPISTAPATPTLITTLPEQAGCPTPIGGGPTPASCDGSVPVGSGCPTPIGGGPTPVTCGVSPIMKSDSIQPIFYTATPVPLLPSVRIAPSGSSCPTPIGGGPTPVSCK